MVDARVFVKYFYVSMELFIAELSEIALWTKSLKYPGTIFFCEPLFLSCCGKAGYRRPMSIINLGNLVTVEMGFRWRVIRICVIKQCKVHPEIFIPRRTWIVMLPAVLRNSIAPPWFCHSLRIVIAHISRHNQKLYISKWSLSVTASAYKTRQIWLKI